MAHIPTSNESAATTRYNMIEVILSESCQRMIDNNITSSCPSMKELIPFDTSNQMVSGKFVNDTDGKVIRTHPQLKNNWLYYSGYNHNIVCVQCNFPFASADLAHIVIIEPQGMTWINKLQGVGENRTVTVYSGRYVTDDCLQATLGYNYDLMADTIYYINSGCTKTSYNNTTFMKTPNTPVDREGSMQYKYEAYLKSVLNNRTYSMTNHTLGGIGPGNCITNNSSCNTSNPFKNPNWNQSDLSQYHPHS